MKIKETVLRVLSISAPAAAVFFLLILFSCATDSEAKKSSAKKGGLPEWALEYPIDPQAFIGVGSSNTGDKGQDMEQARLRALADLSSSISTQIESELVIESQDDTKGNLYEKMTEKIRENVKQNLQGVEPVDSYYSETDGYWIYYRFPKSKLAEMKNDLKTRVLALVDPVFSDSTSIAEKLAILWDGRNLIQDSPFVGTIKAVIGGRSGSLIDLLDQHITQLTGSLSLEASPREIKIEEGNTVNISLSITSSVSADIGQFQAVLWEPNGTGEIARVVTEKDGSYTGKLDIAVIKPGKNLFNWTIDFAPLGLDRAQVRLFSPVAEQYFEIQKLSVGLSVSVDSGDDIPGLKDSIVSVFSQGLYAQIVDTYNPKKTNILCTIYFTDFPKNDYGLFFTNARAVINIVRDGRSLFSYETDEYKEGGLTKVQAKERAKNKLIHGLEMNQELLDKINKALISTNKK